MSIVIYKYEMVSPSFCFKNHLFCGPVFKKSCELSLGGSEGFLASALLVKRADREILRMRWSVGKEFDVLWECF
jgi:hypothetical protein